MCAFTCLDVSGVCVIDGKDIVACIHLATRYARGEPQHGEGSAGSMLRLDVRLQILPVSEPLFGVLTTGKGAEIIVYAVLVVYMGDPRREICVRPIRSVTVIDQTKIGA